VSVYNCWDFDCTCSCYILW